MSINDIEFHLLCFICQRCDECPQFELTTNSMNFCCEINILLGIVTFDCVPNGFSS